MPVAIKLDHQLRRHAGEIGNERTYGFLTTELEVFEATVAKQVPQRTLGISLTSPQRSCGLALCLLRTASA